MSLSNEQIIEAISSKSLVEVMELVKAMEEKFGVSAAAPVAVAAGPAAGAAATATGAAAETPNFSSIALTCSITSRRDLLEIASMI